jgi:DNA-directed RNA polymerase specialized sigma24 family protein
VETVLALDLHNFDGQGSTLQDTVARKVPQREEAWLRERIAQRDYTTVARAVLYTYGSEVFGFLVGVLDDSDVAGVVYADVCQRVATEIESVRSDLALRTWFYALARRELRDRRMRARRSNTLSPVERGLPNSESKRPAALTSVVDAIRKTLTEEELELLILRLDRHFDWFELARTEPGENAPQISLSRLSQRLRARVDELLKRIGREARQHVQGR